MTTEVLEPSRTAVRSQTGWLIWAVVAAFGTYFCMYAFRKPFTAATFSDQYVFETALKPVLVIAQTLGYMVSKFVGIKVVAESSGRWRALGILLLIGFAELALLLFAVVPAPWNVACLFLNGLPLGMVFGLVLGVLEGRRQTEALTAGLCASFIVADGVVTSAGAWLMERGVSPFSMPAITGLIFTPPLLLFVWMLSLVPPPSAEDIAQRTERVPMLATERRAFFRRYAVGLTLVVLFYLALTVLRSLRSDFKAELFLGLTGTKATPSQFVWTEMIVAFGVVLVNGLSILIRDNRRAFNTAIGVSFAGLVLVCCMPQMRTRLSLEPMTFMVLLGLGLYLPYVAVHTTIFERLIAMTRDRGNIGYLMYVADAFGYLGVVAILLGKGVLANQQNFLGFFEQICLTVGSIAALCLVLSWLFFARHRQASA